MKKSLKAKPKKATKTVALATRSNLKVLPPVPAPDKQVLVVAISDAISYDMKAYHSWMAQSINPNPVMKTSKFTGYHMFEEMDADARVYNASRTKKVALLSRPFYTRSAIDRDPLEEEKAALLRWNFNYIKGLVKKKREILSKYDYGFSVSELIYERVPEVVLPPRTVRRVIKGKVVKTTIFVGKTLKNVAVIKDIKTKVPSAFSFDRDGNMWMADVKKIPDFVPKFTWGAENPGHRLLTDEENQHFMVCTHDPRFGSRYGWPLRASIFFDLLMKRAGKIYRMIRAEKFGMPFVKGTYPNDTQADTAQFEEKLKGLQKNSYIMTPEGFAIEFIEMMNAGGPFDLYEKLMEFCDGNTSEVYLGHRHALSGSDSPSPFSSDDNKTLLRQDLLEEDATELDEDFNDIFIPRLIDMNYTPNGFYPYIVTDVEPPKDKSKLLFEYQGLYNMRVPISLAEIYERLGHSQPEDDDDVLLLEETEGEKGVVPNPDNAENTQVDGFQNKEGSPTDAFQNAFQAAITKFYEDNLKPKENGSPKRKTKKLVNRDPITKLILSIDEEEV